MLANRMIAKRWKAVVLIAAGIVVTVVACESRVPTETGATEQKLREKVAQPKTIEGQPAIATTGAVPGQDTIVEVPNMVLSSPDAIQLIDKYYPPVVRAAGIGGFAVVKLNVHQDGRVDGFELRKSTGHEALDAAALRVARELKMLPTLRRSSKGVQEYNVVLTFDPKAKSRKLVPTRQPLKVPGSAVVAPDAEQPVFTPYDQRPALSNREEVKEVLQQSYPRMLRDAGIGGTALLWVKVRADGTVEQTQVKTSAGREELDAAARRVAARMQFSPARNKGEATAVWIQLPIVFKTQ